MAAAPEFPFLFSQFLVVGVGAGAFFLGSWWLPLVPALLALNLAAGASLVESYVQEVRQWNRTLEARVEEQSQQLAAQLAVLDLSRQSQLLGRAALETSVAVQLRLQRTVYLASQLERMGARFLMRADTSPLSLTEMFSERFAPSERAAIAGTLAQLRGCLAEMERDWERVPLWLSIFPSLQWFYPEFSYEPLTLPADLTQTILPLQRDFF